MKTHAILALALTACSGADAGDRRTGTLVITDVSAVGDADWFEVVNASDRDVALSDYVFVDDVGDLDRAAAFPDGVVLAPGASYVQTVSADHHGFQLGRDEELWIYRAADGELSDGLDWDAEELVTVR